MLIGIPTESVSGETRVAASPETIKKFTAQGHTVRVQRGPGLSAAFTDAAYAAAGAQPCNAACIAPSASISAAGRSRRLRYRLWRKASR